MLGAQDVAYDDRHQVELRSDPHPDREVVDRRPATRGLLQPPAEIEPDRREVDELTGLPDQEVAPPRPCQHGEREQPEHVLRGVHLVHQQEPRDDQEGQLRHPRGLGGAQSQHADREADRPEQHPRPLVDAVGGDRVAGVRQHQPERTEVGAPVGVEAPEDLPLLEPGQPGRAGWPRPRRPQRHRRPTRTCPWIVVARPPPGSGRAGTADTAWWPHPARSARRSGQGGHATTPTGRPRPSRRPSGPS